MDDKMGQHAYTTEVSVSWPNLDEKNSIFIQKVWYTYLISSQEPYNHFFVNLKPKLRCDASEIGSVSENFGFSPLYKTLEKAFLSKTTCNCQREMQGEILQQR